MLETLIQDLRATTKPDAKIVVLQKLDSNFLRCIIQASLEPFMLFHVKLKPEDMPKASDGSIDTFEVQEEFRLLLAAFQKNNSNKQNRLQAIAFLSTLNKGSQELVFSTLNKDWKAGVSTKAIRKLFPGLVSSFEVQLSNKYLEVKEKKTYKPKSRWCSYKLDGVRCVFLRMLESNDSVWRAYSRQGKEFKTVDHLKPQLEYLWEQTGTDFWDGELYIDSAPFEYIQGRSMSFTKGTSHDLDFRAFICGDKEAFLQCVEGHASFKIVTDEYLDNIQAPQIKLAEQWMITEEQIDEELEKAFDMGYEGIMLRDPEMLYEFKRSDALLKLKEGDNANSQEQTADCLVLDVIMGQVTVVIDEAMTYQTLVTKLIVEQKDGTICTVGSGFDLDFRYYYTEHPEEIKGKVTEIKFQGYGGKGRMRFPRLFRIREDLTWGE
ncbi:hypothetical protein JZU46_02945 [bacterium]|nr:hypothetical protein [bacterium]